MSYINIHLEKKKFENWIFKIFFLNIYWFIDVKRTIPMSDKHTISAIIY